MSVQESDNGGKAALVFDWGNTLMKVFPQYNGPMATWPEVAEVDGVVEALEALLGRCLMVVATNAADSNAGEVWKALKRVGLGEYFKAVFTYKELGSKKPDLPFFRQLESVLDRPPYHLVMIGDDFRADMLGAKAAGWKAIWYNPEWQAAPGLLPLHDAEIHDLRELPQAVYRLCTVASLRTVGSLALPDYPTCLNWLLGRDIPFNILEHVQTVGAAAYQLALWLGKTGKAVDPILTHRGGLLHDLAKIDSLRRDASQEQYIDHGALARALLLERGQPELAEIAHRHMLYARPDDPRRPQTWEQKLVHYADKLAEGSRLVPLEERLDALKGRYPQAVREMEASWPVISELQGEICEALGTTPSELIERLRQSFWVK